MTSPDLPDDATMETALDWFMQRQQAEDKSMVDRAMQRWLTASEAHRQAWQRVNAFWELAGELPEDYAETLTEPQAEAVQKPVTDPSGSAKETGVTYSTVGNSTSGKVKHLSRHFSRHKVMHQVRHRIRHKVQWVAATALAASLALQFLPGNSDLSRTYYNTGSAERTALTLVDGSVLHLDAESRVAVSLGDSLRHVDLLAGRVFFEVSHDTSRPFTVNAGGLDVTVTGTAFSVGRDSDAASVTVQSGSVRIAPSGSAREHSDLTAGDKLLLPRKATSLAMAVRSRVEAENVAAWREGLLVADDMRLSSLLEVIDRYYSGSIWLSDLALGERRVTGVFDLDNPELALRAIAGAHNARINPMSGDVLAVMSR